jgi:serine/threonine protein kinase
MGSSLDLSPEQNRKQTVGGASDIFSVGVVIYEMLCGTHPFRANTLGAVYERITNEAPADISTFRRDFPKGVSYVVLSGVVGIKRNGRPVDKLQEGDCFGEMGYLSIRKTLGVSNREHRGSADAH